MYIQSGPDSRCNGSVGVHEYVQFGADTTVQEVYLIMFSLVLTQRFCRYTGVYSVWPRRRSSVGKLMYVQFGPDSVAYLSGSNLIQTQVSMVQKEYLIEYI